MEVRVKEKGRETKLLRAAHIFIPTDFIVCITRNNLMYLMYLMYRIYIKRIKYTLHIPFSF